MRLFRGLAVCLLALFVPACSVAGAAEGPPEILIIMPDQMRGDCLSSLDHPAVATPTLDRLAREGTLFRRAYTTIPSCIPARYAMLTGLYPQSSGVVGFRKKPIRWPTLPELLGEAGYTTALVGREMHQLAPDSELGYQMCLHGSTYTSDDEYARQIQEAFPQIDAFRQWVTEQGWTYNHWQAKPWSLPEEWHPTSWIVRNARQWLKEISDDRPLCLTASFYAPHPPLFPPKDLFEKYLAAELPDAAHGDWVDWKSLTHEGADGGQRVLLTGERLRRAQAGYYGLIEHIDREIGGLIADFQARAEKTGRPWVIVFTSDHGEMLGDHGYFRKCEPLEGSANVPMIIAASSDLDFRRGQRSTRPVCLEDVLPTLLDLAGKHVPEHIDGVSLVPALRGEPAEIRPWLHFEHAPAYSKAQAFHALTDGHVKYIWRPLDGSELLFDLDADPRELRNLADDPEHAESLEKWRATLIDRLAPRPEGFSDGERLIPGRPYPPLNEGLRTITHMQVLGPRAF